jgi:hypothetical protein
LIADPASSRLVLALAAAESCADACAILHVLELPCRYDWIRSSNRFRRRAVCRGCESVARQTQIIEQKKNSNRGASLSMFDPPSASLIAKGILGFTSGVIPAFRAPVVIRPDAWKYLQKHPESVDLEKKDIGTAKYENGDTPWVNVDVD